MQCMCLQQTAVEKHRKTRVRIPMVKLHFKFIHQIYIEDISLCTCIKFVEDNFVGIK